MNGHALGIDGWVCFEIILYPAHAPGPGSDGAPVIISALALAGLEILGANAICKAIGHIGIDVAVVVGRHTEAGFEQRQHIHMAKALKCLRWSDALACLRIPNG